MGIILASASDWSPRPLASAGDFAGSIRRKAAVRGNLALLTGLVIVGVFSFDL